MGLVGFSPGGEKGYTAGIEWILQQLQMYNKDFDYPVYALSLFFLFPLSPCIFCNSTHQSIATTTTFKIFAYTTFRIIPHSAL
jgi:hypothetical protein